MSLDTHLSTLLSTLGDIETLHARSTRAKHRPFTAAILNTYKLDVLDFIRDADAFEANLFWYPTTSVAGPSVTSTVASTSAAGRRDAMDVEASTVPEISLAPRLPEPKTFVPPTPLRKAVREAEAKGLIEFDARTLLKAAQRLTDNYHNVPRARKHIKALLRRHGELQRSIRNLEVSVVESDTLIGKLQTEGKQLAQRIRSSATPAASTPEDMARIQDAIRREEMEIMAIEQTMEEIEERKARRKLQAEGAAKQKPVRTMAPAEATPKRAPAASRTSVGGGRTPNQRTPTATQAAGPTRSPNSARKSMGGPQSSLSPLKGKVQAVAAKVPMATPSKVDVADETIRLRPPAAADLADETIRLRPDEAVEATTLDKGVEKTGTSGAAGVPSTDELERICENIWSIFGEHLRFVAPDRDSADLGETLAILSLLSEGKGHADAKGDGDISMASSNATGTTAATSGSTATVTALPTAGAPSTATAISARLLILLLSTPPPHSMASDDLKRQAGQWWQQTGCHCFPSSDEPASVQQGEELANKAIYALVAKKLLKLRFVGAVRTVSFPANIL